MNKYYELKCQNPSIEHFNDENLHEINNYDNSIIIDLIDVFMSVGYHDFLTIRDEHVDNNYKLNITIPVNNKIKFESIKNELNDLVRFMTGEKSWNINFSEEIEKKSICRKELKMEISKKYESIALLSGGLDALSGASAEVGNKTIFVTYNTNDQESKKARSIYNEKIKTNDNMHIEVKKPNFSIKNVHPNQRTRTLVFMACTFIYADYYNIPKIKIYENGIMSLNPSFYYSRDTTKTTHPKTIYLVNEILKKLDINFKIENPYMFLTKSEVLNKIPEDWLYLVSKTRTCSKRLAIVPISHTMLKGETHCGICTACILREISIISENIDKYDVKYIVPANCVTVDEIKKLERNRSSNKNVNFITNYAQYKFKEKNSLIVYYRRFYTAIRKGEILYELDLNPKIFDDQEYYSKLNSMLEKFSKELEVYFSKIGVIYK